MTDKKQKIIHLNNNKKHLEKTALGSLLLEIFNQFTRELKPKLMTCFEVLDDCLFDMAEKAESNQDQTLYFEAMRFIRKSKNKIYSDFFNSIQSTFGSFKKNQYDFFHHEVKSSNNTHKADLDNLSLSLVDEKELDETLAKTNLINKSEMAFHRQLFAIEKRFSVLASGTKLKANQIPIGPDVIVNSFAKSIKILDIEVKLKLILYKIFERNVMGQLNPVYTSINDFLSEKGIIPEIKYDLRNTSSANQASVIRNKPNIENSKQQVQNPRDSNENSSAIPMANNQSSTGQKSQFLDPNYQLISQLFKQNNQISASQGSVNLSNVMAHEQAQINAPDNIDMGSMINALSMLQGDVFKNVNVNDAHYKSPIEIKDELLRQLHNLDSSTQKKVVRQKDEDTIDLVGMLFQFIVEDRNLPDAIQVILAKLQIPYLKIALQDRNIFADKSHPARVLLDSLSMASVGWSEETDNKLQFINKVEDVVHHILENEELSIDLFKNLHVNFNHFLKKSQKKADIIQRRTNEKSLGQEKIDLAKKRAAQLLVDKMTHKRMPALMRDILLGEWSNVLVLMQLRYSQESKEYKSKILFIDKLIEFSQVTEDVQQVAHGINDLSKAYEEGLKLVAFNPKEIIDKQHKLVNCLKEIHQLNDQPEENMEVELIPPSEILKLSEIRNKNNEIVNYIEQIIEPNDNKDVFDDSQDQFLDTITSLKIGSWLEFVKDNGPNIRAKLSWISPITNNYLFVNSKGLKITDKNKFELAAGLRDKSIRLLQHMPLFDRALSSIAKNMKTKSK